jgi:site-specific recombinase XerD
VQDRPRANVLRWRHPVTQGRARRGVCTVQKKYVMFLVSFNGAEFLMPNQRRNASPSNTVNCTVRKYLTAREIEKLMDYARKLRRESPTEASYVFVTERGGPMSTIGFHHLIQRLGKAARMPFSLHPHMLRHACGYKLANDGHDTRALQHYLGHKNIQHTVRYTELSPDRFRDFWRD